MSTTIAQSACPRCAGPAFDLDGPEPTIPGPHCTFDERNYWCKICTCPPGEPFSCETMPRVRSTPQSTPQQLADDKRDCAGRSWYIDETLSRNKIQPRQRLQWVNRAADSCRLAAGEDDQAGYFWIFLYGVLLDIHSDMTGMVKFAQDNGSGSAKAVRLVAAFVDEVERLATLFTDEEKLYLQYRRDNECHPVQQNYEFLMNGKGEIRQTFKANLLMRVPVSIRDFRAAVRRILGASGNDELKLARQYAARCARQLEVVRQKGAVIFS